MTTKHFMSSKNELHFFPMENGTKSVPAAQLTCRAASFTRSRTLAISRLCSRWRGGPATGRWLQHHASRLYQFRFEIDLRACESDCDWTGLFCDLGLILDFGF